jgi:predicted enzyme related to lactoylglutathione lyase
MIRQINSVTYFSENAKKLADFYKEKVGLKVTTEAEMGDKGEEFYGFEFGKNTGFYIVDHSKVKGKNKNPERMIVNLEVDDIKTEVKRLVQEKVKLIQETYHVEGYGWIATFEDVDGNYFQFVQVRAN